MQGSLTHAPANHCCFDGAVCIHALPRTASPSTQERNDIGADVILAQQLEWLIRRRHAFMSEIIDSRLPRRHANIRLVLI